MTELEFGRDARFSLRRQLGSGGFGVVYEAYDRHRETAVALKTLKQVTPEHLYPIKREFRSLAGLRHRNLIELYELQYIEGQWLIAMELIEGTTFTRWVRPSDPPAARHDRWRRTGRAICAAYRLN